jgi:large subunit ribosomal protein L14e
MADIELSNSSWKRVEVGRVVVLPSGTIATIVEIIDHKRVRWDYSRCLMDRVN